MASLLISFLWVADWLLEAAGGVHKGEVCTGLGSTAEGVIHRRKPNENIRRLEGASLEFVPIPFC